MLCTYSVSRVYSSEILQACPLQLTKSQHNRCPCRKRIYRGDLRVLSCTFPKTYKGKEITNPERFRAALIGEMNLSKVEIENEELTMTTAEKKPLWGGVKIPVFGITGEKFSGKSVLASAIDPERTLYVDAEKSTETYNFPFAQRFDLYNALDRRLKGKVPTSLDSFLCVKEEVIEKLEGGKFTVLVFDPWNDLEAGLTDYVYENAANFGKTKAQYDKGGGLLWGDVKSYMKLMLGSLTNKVETVVFINHMGFVWKGAAPTEKRKAKGKETIYELASLYLELQRKPEIKPDGKVVTPKVPAGVVLKSRLAHHRFVDGDLEVTPILPPRLPEATPKAIREYIANPPNWEKLKKGEMAQQDEPMSEDEKLRLKAEIAENERAAEESKASRLEKMAEAARKQAEANAARQQRADAAKATAEAKAEEPAPTPTDESAPFDTPKEADIYETIMAQRKQLGISDADWSKVLAKRNAKETRDLTAEQAEEIRKNLWNKLTTQDMQKAASASVVKNRLAATSSNGHKS